jgi:pimeloyl-ACP methyl ester carboxylesterase
MSLQAPTDPPPIPGARRRRVSARDVDFHVVEAGPDDGQPVLLLHGWPQHHYAWRHLLGDPPDGVRLLAPDLPGYGWSGPAPHAWEKEEVASDLLALLDALGLERVVLVGHDWGGYIGFLLTLRAPERFSAYLALNIAHPWQTPATLIHLWRFLSYQPMIAALGVPIQRFTPLVRIGVRAAIAVRTPEVTDAIDTMVDRFREPEVAAAGRDTYRTFWLREIPHLVRHRERRRSRVPTRMVFGRRDVAIDPALAAERTAVADDYTLELIDGTGHFIADERPELIRARLVQLVREFPPHAAGQGVGA